MKIPWETNTQIHTRQLKSYLPSEITAAVQSAVVKWQQEHFSELSVAARVPFLPHTYRNNNQLTLNGKHFTRNISSELKTHLFRQSYPDTVL